MLNLYLIILLLTKKLLEGVNTMDVEFKLLGKKDAQVSLDEGATVDDLIHEVGENGSLDGYEFKISGERVERDKTLSNGDTLVVVPESKGGR